MTLRDRIWCWWNDVCPKHFMRKRGAFKLCGACIVESDEKETAQIAAIRQRAGVETTGGSQ